MKKIIFYIMLIIIFSEETVYGFMGELDDPYILPEPYSSQHQFVSKFSPYLFFHINRLDNSEDNIIGIPFYYGIS